MTTGRFHREITRRRRWRDNDGALHVDVEQDAVQWRATQVPPMRVRAKRREANKVAAASRRRNRR